MKANNPLENIEILFQSFIKENDFDTFHNNLLSYFNFIEDTYPLKDIVQSLFTSRSSPSIFHNVNGLYQLFVFNKRDPRFSVSPQSIGSSGISLFHKYLTNKLKEIYPDEAGKYLYLDGDFFLYNGAKLEIKEGTYRYDILRVIYSTLNGKSGEIMYKDLFKELRKFKKFKNKTDEYILERVHKYVTSTKEGLSRKIKETESNGFRLVEVIKNTGIRFNNG